MKKSFTIYDGDATMTIDMTNEKAHAVLQKVVEWMVAVDGYSGEGIMQSDKSQIEAAPFLADLVDDIIQPDIDWHE